MGKMTLRDINDTLDSLPYVLDRVYDKMLDIILDQGKDRSTCALKILSWILYSFRPLRTVEIQHALAVRLGDSKFDETGIPEIDDLLTICAGMVIIGENDTV